MKDWMKGPFLTPGDIKFNNSTPETITVYPELFAAYFDEKDVYSAFHSYWVYYHSEVLSFADVDSLLQNFTRCVSCEEWFDRDELVDTNEMIGGGIGYVCEACASTLG